MPSARTLVALVGATLAAALVVMSVIHVAAPQRDGPLALSQILAPYGFVLLVPFLLLVRTPGGSGRALRWGLLAAALVFAVRFVPTWIPTSPGNAAVAASGTPRIGVATWNLELGQPATDGTVARLRELAADVVGLVELTPGHAQAIAGDPDLRRRHPTMVLHPTEGSLGIGLLSTLPAVGPARVLADPPILVQRLRTPEGGTLTVVVAHPLPGRISTLRSLLPIDYDATPRDRHLAQVRGIVDPILATGEPLLLIGDFNVVDREPGYDDLVRGLVDAQRAVGVGPGNTWRPGRLEWLPFGLLRIDLLLSGNGVVPLSLTTDCTPSGSDHCLVQGVMALPASR